MKKNLFWMSNVGVCLLFFIFTSSFSLRAMISAEDSEDMGGPIGIVSEGGKKNLSEVLANQILDDLDDFVPLSLDGGVFEDPWDFVLDALGHNSILALEEAMLYGCNTATPKTLETILDLKAWKETGGKTPIERLKRATGFLVPFVKSKAVISGTLPLSNPGEKDRITWDILQDMASKCLEDLESRGLSGESFDENVLQLIKNKEEILDTLRSENYVPMLLGVEMAKSFTADKHLWRHLIKRDLSLLEKELLPSSGF